MALHMNISRENFPMRACALDELKGRYPGRSRECERLFSLLGEPGIAIPLYLYGPSGCGKSAVLSGVLEALEIRTAFVDCVTHPTPQSIFESALNQLAGHRPQASNGYSCWSSCDSPAAFVAGLRQLVAVRKRVCLVFDKAERLSARGGGLMQVLIALPSLCAAAAAASEPTAPPVMGLPTGGDRLGWPGPGCRTPRRTVNGNHDVDIEPELTGMLTKAPLETESESYKS